MQKLFLVLAVSAVISAQAPPVTERKLTTVIAAPGVPGAGAGGFTWMSAQTNFEAALVKGVPFSGDFVTENSQTLADGNRIRSTNTTTFARDSEGRTRREITVDRIGPFAGNTARKTIFINDPVAKIDYILDPESKTARTIHVGAMMNRTIEDGGGAQAVTINRQAGGPNGAAVVIEPRVEGDKNVVFTRSIPGVAMAERMPLPPGIVMEGNTGAVIRQSLQVGEGHIMTAGNANFKNEPLGKRMIDGVEAEGTRSTLTIPAGQIGNDLPIDTISERWYSDELKTTVMTTRKDPRTGEIIYRLTNLRRGEPARQLFEVPPDYKIIENSGSTNIMRLQVDKKE